MSENNMDPFAHPSPGEIRDPELAASAAEALASKMREGGVRTQDIRLGQFLVNVLNLNGYSPDALFYIEDKALRLMVEKYPVRVR